MRSTAASIVSAVIVSALAFGPAVATAQDPPAVITAGPCRDRPCVLVFDWGAGKTSATYGPDRRYGSGDDFEAKVRSALAARGIRTREPPGAGALTLTVRPTVRTGAMCDQMPGTNTDYSCIAMQDVAVTFASGDPAVKPPGALRVSNRCGATDVYMTMDAFGQFSADLIWFSLEGEKAKQRRPIGRC